MRIWSAAVVFLFACGPDEPANVPTAQTVTVPSAPATTPAPIASAAPAATAATPEPAATAKADAKFKVTATMKMDGQVDDKALEGETNAQIEEVSKCAAIVRKTDHVTGSMNLKVTIAKDGTTKGDLQSPASEPAKKCILDAVGKWKLVKSGPGTAGVLLNIVE